MQQMFAYGGISRHFFRYRAFAASRSSFQFGGVVGVWSRYCPLPKMLALSILYCLVRVMCSCQIRSASLSSPKTATTGCPCFCSCLVKNRKRRYPFSASLAFVGDQLLAVPTLETTSVTSMLSIAASPVIRSGGRLIISRVLESQKGRCERARLAYPR